MDDRGTIELNYCSGCMRRLDPGETLCPYCGYDNSVNHNSPDQLPEGTMLGGHYLLGKVLGQGGFGITYLGIDLSLQKRIAVKEYFPRGVCSRMSGTNRVTGAASLSHPEDFRSSMEEFGREAQTLAQISSPNIVRVLNTFRENGTAYIVMEYADGITLSKEVRNRGGRLPWQRVTELFRDLIRELGKLHEKHLIHRDIKPDNLRIVRDENRDEKLVLLDFGTARRFESAEVSQTYTAMLTPGYAPLEQYSSKGKQGPYTDIYALCATMYAVITGKIPPAASDRSMGDARLEGISEQGLNVPERVEKAILHGLEVRREDRPQRMADLYAELYGDEQKPAADDPKELIYQTGKKLMGEGSPEAYQQALGLFKQIPGWKDAGQMAEVCRRKMREGASTIKTGGGSKSPKPDPKKWLLILLIAALIGGGVFFALNIQKKTISIQQTQTAFYLLQAGTAEAETPQPPSDTDMPVPSSTNTVEPTAKNTEAPTSTDTPEPAITEVPAAAAEIPTEIPVSGSPVNVGDIITMGHYEQDGDLTNGTEAIEWQVLAVEDGRALVISRYGLDAKPYNEKSESVTWETCTLRTWLNGEFYNSAFSSEEKGWILQVTLKNPNNAEYGTKGGNDTTDRIFLLSIEEAEQYFVDDESRKCWPTAYAKNIGAFASDLSSDTLGAWWWLRSPARNNRFTVLVGTNGSVYGNGRSVDNSNIAARPAFWLDLNAGADVNVPFSLGPASEATSVLAETAEPIWMPDPDAKVGDIITMGHYEQDGDKDNGTESIEWQVLAVEDGRALVISKYALDRKKYNEKWTSMTWEMCTLRAWLNGEFYNSAFSSEEKGRIRQVTVKNPDNERWRTKGGNDTTDRIFLLSIDEANRYFADDEARKCRPTTYVTYHGAWVFKEDGGTVRWWLRSPGIGENYAACVNNGGDVDVSGYSLNNIYNVVRPVFWLDL